MIQPNELKLHLPMTVGGKMKATTTQVWLVLQASYYGDIEKVKALADECPGLLYAQYNYAPPIHFAVREGHHELVNYLLENGAHDPAYRIYPFLDSLQVLARDRGLDEIAAMLDNYAANGKVRYTGDNGNIHYNRSKLQTDFQAAVNNHNLKGVREMLERAPELALDQTYFWSEGILCMPAKGGHYALIELLMHYGAKVPDMLKWAQAYYFETYEHAAFMMEHGMNPNVMSWQHVTLLHDMAQKGFIAKAELLLKYGAELNPVDEQYQSTPLGMAARWGHLEMAEYLLAKGADPDKAGAPWATPMAWAIKKGHKEIEEKLKRI